MRDFFHSTAKNEYSSYKALGWATKQRQQHQNLYSFHNFTSTRRYSGFSFGSNPFLLFTPNTLLDCYSNNNNNNTPTYCRGPPKRIGQRSTGSKHTPFTLLPFTTTNREQQRYYHTTRKQEILPVIVVGAVLVIGVRYSYRAWQRMKEEQEDYQYNLQVYERQQLKYQQQQQQQQSTTAADGTTTATPNSNFHDNDRSIITMAVDLGTTYMKLATATYRPMSPVTVQISREGDRSTFNGVIYDDDDDDMGRRMVQATGRAALERYFYPNTRLLPLDGPTTTTTSHHPSEKNTVSLPFLEFSTAHDDDNDSASSSSSPPTLPIVTHVLQSRLVEVMDRLHSSIITTTSSSTTSNQALVRHVVTVPSIFCQHSERILKMYQNSFIDCCTKYTRNQPFDTESLLVTFLPEPVATVWGAQFHNMLPSNLPKDIAAMASYCIIDVGGWTSQISIVQNDKLKHTVTIPWGGECLIEQLVLLLKQQQQQSSTSTLNDSRSLSLLQYHARQAVVGLASQTRVSLHVPYLFADPKQHHLEANMARDVLNQAVEDNIRNLLKHQKSAESGEASWLSNTILSPHLPSPNNLTSLWTSILTQALEQSGHIPTNVSAVVLVGGGSKYPYVQSTIKDAWNMLTGGISGTGDAQFHFDASLSSELTVVGAATIPPSFDYSLTDGLVRRH